MKESIRCCISCILPCGALDVIRIVHASGRVEEITHSVFARDIMQAYPKHVLRKPLSVHDLTDNHHQGGPCNVVLPPNAELQRGKIYFLMPLRSSTSHNNNNNTVSSSSSANPNNSATKSPARRRRKKRVEDSSSSSSSNSVTNVRELSMLSNGEEDRTRLLLSDQYLSEILSEKVSSQRERRRGRVGVWRPHLESISENITNDF